MMTWIERHAAELADAEGLCLELMKLADGRTGGYRFPTETLGGYDLAGGVHFREIEEAMAFIVGYSVARLRFENVE